MQLTKDEVKGIMAQVFRKGISCIQYHPQKEEISCHVQFGFNGGGCMSYRMGHLTLKDPALGKDSLSCKTVTLYDKEIEKYIKACTAALK